MGTKKRVAHTGKVKERLTWKKMRKRGGGHLEENGD
jgi:hypothetical protein